MIAVFPMLENKWEVTIAIQTVLTKNGSLDNAAKNILLAALEKSISLDTYNESADMGNTFSYLEETEERSCDFHIKKFCSSLVSYLVSLTGIGTSKDRNLKKNMCCV